MLNLTMRVIRKSLLIVGLVALLLLVGRGGTHISAIDIAAAPFRYNLLTWEATHLPSKWLHWVWETLTRKDKDRDERLALTKEFFRIGEELAQLEKSLDGRDNPDSPGTFSVSTQSTEELRARLLELNAQVEEAVESEVSTVLAQEGLASRQGLIFPPVDVVFGDTPKVLAVSPRERIELQKTILLRPSIEVEEVERLEGTVSEDEEISALVVGIGGVGTYPSLVSAQNGLLHAVTTTVHEWLHHFLFFRPLGQSYWRSDAMATLNETAVTLASEELGDRVYQAITGEKPLRPPKKRNEESGFNIEREMRKTRLRVEDLLAQGRVEEAEKYMEQRRLIFIKQGYYTRKLNQAYFAFQGVYGDDPASISPIHDQLVRLRVISPSVGDFIREVARFRSYQDFKDHLEGTQREADDAQTDNGSKSKGPNGSANSP